MSKGPLFCTILAIGFLMACGQSVPPSDPQPGIAFVSDRDGNWEIYLIQPDGSSLTRLTDHPALDADPAWSPDGQQLAFRSRRHGSSDIFIMAADGSHPTNLVNDPPDSPDDEFSPTWNPDGQLLALYTDRFIPPPSCRGGAHQLALMAVSGGSRSLRLLGVVPGEQESFSWSPDGQALAFSSNCNSDFFQIYLWERDSNLVQPLTSDPYQHTSPAWSPDGRFLALVSNREGNSDIYLLSLENNQFTNLTRHPARDTQPTWSPTGDRIAFTSDRDGNQEIYLLDASGENLRNLTNHPAQDWNPAWSPIP